MPELTVAQVMESKILAEPVRLLDMCPQSDGACALVWAVEGKAERICPRPAWLQATATRHDKPYLGDHGDRLSTMRTLRSAAAEVYEALDIREPLKEFDVAEIYEPVSYAELAWYEALGFCAEGESSRLAEDGVTALDGELPVNPSGGVLSTNPVGASGVIRAAEAALQIHGRGGRRQVPDVCRALVTGYGVYSWSDVMVLGAEKP
jgi:acetyl-CoA C-acetyltransferase